MLRRTKAIFLSIFFAIADLQGMRGGGGGKIPLTP